MLSEYESIISTRKFNGNRIHLHAIHNSHFDIYTIIIVDILPKPAIHFNPYGIFLSKTDVMKKLNSINL